MSPRTCSLPTETFQSKQPNLKLLLPSSFCCQAQQFLFCGLYFAVKESEDAPHSPSMTTPTKSSNSGACHGEQEAETESKEEESEKEEECYKSPSNQQRNYNG
jgi:hypothetical protein